MPKCYEFLLILWSFEHVLLLHNSDLFGLCAVRLDYLDSGHWYLVLMFAVTISIVLVTANDYSLSLVYDLKVRWVDAVPGFLQL